MVRTPLNVIWDIFMFFWAILDVIFSYIEYVFINVFHIFPISAIPFVIGIACYSMATFLEVIIEDQPKGNKRLGLFILYKLYIVFMLLFTIWRFGIITQIESRVSVETMSEFFVNMAYILFGMAIVVAFIKKITWLKKVIIIFLWFMFFILTWIICPILQESTLSDYTLFHTLVLGAIFVVPNSVQQYQKGKKKGVA